MSDVTSRRAFIAGVAAAATAGATTSKPACPSELEPAEPRNPPAVTYGTLGRTGLKVSRVGFGCMITSDPTVIELAADMGINYFDTARVYMGGNNERMVGAVLKPRRKNVIISTKVLQRGAAGAASSLDTSLKELGTDYVDLWYLHDIRRPDELTPELIEVQQKAKQAGKIRFAAVSVHSNHREVLPVIIQQNKWDVLMVTYNYALDRGIEPLIREARDKGIGIVAMKVMAGSFKLKGATDDDFQARMKRSGAPLAALKWCVRAPFIDTAIPSMRDQDQLLENFTAMATPFKAEDERVLTAQLEHIGPLYCRMCGTCAGQCSQGLPVSDIIRYVTYCDGYGEYSLARENFQTLPPGLRDVRCSDCESCSIQCPNGVRVRERVARAQTLFA